MLRFEYRCPVHGHMIDLEDFEYETCQFVSEDVRCKLPLIVYLVVPEPAAAPSGRARSESSEPTARQPRRHRRFRRHAGSLSGS